jgi:hypothetical protein
MSSNKLIHTTADYKKDINFIIQITNYFIKIT